MRLVVYYLSQCHEIRWRKLTITEALPMRDLYKKKNVSNNVLDGLLAYKERTSHNERRINDRDSLI